MQHLESPWHHNQSIAMGTSSCFWSRKAVLLYSTGMCNMMWWWRLHNRSSLNIRVQTLMTLISSLTAEYSTEVKTDSLKCVWSDQGKRNSLITGLLVTPNDVMEDDVWRTSTILVAGLLYCPLRCNCVFLIQRKYALFCVLFSRIC